jgi:histidine triad (HIT) family protein
MAECVFCQIVRGQSPDSRIWEDAEFLAFMDIRPITPGHLLVIPKRHVAYLDGISPEECGRLFAAAHKLAAAVRNSGLRCEGVNLHLADGEAAGQEVFHVHAHVFPRYAHDGFGFRFGPGYDLPPDRRALDENARRIREGLEHSETR